MQGTPLHAWQLWQTRGGCNRYLIIITVVHLSHHPSPSTQLAGCWRGLIKPLLHPAGLLIGYKSPRCDTIFYEWNRLKSTAGSGSEGATEAALIRVLCENMHAAEVSAHLPAVRAAHAAPGGSTVELRGGARQLHAHKHAHITPSQNALAGHCDVALRIALPLFSMLPVNPTHPYSACSCWWCMLHCCTSCWTS